MVQFFACDAAHNNVVAQLWGAVPGHVSVSSVRRDRAEKMQNYETSMKRAGQSGILCFVILRCSVVVRPMQRCCVCV